MSEQDMGAQFTPGPWSLGQIDEEGRWIDAKNGSPKRHLAKWMGLATVVVDIECDPEGSAEGEANARLIAAAPELYEALEALANDLGAMKADLANHPSALGSLIEARAALAKARAPTPQGKANG